MAVFNAVRTTPNRGTPPEIRKTSVGTAYGSWTERGPTLNARNMSKAALRWGPKFAATRQ